MGPRKENPLPLPLTELENNPVEKEVTAEPLNEFQTKILAQVNGIFEQIEPYHEEAELVAETDSSTTAGEIQINDDHGEVFIAEKNKDKETLNKFYSDLEEAVRDPEKISKILKLKLPKSDSWLIAAIDEEFVGNDLSLRMKIESIFVDAGYTLISDSKRARKNYNPSYRPNLVRQKKEDPIIHILIPPSNVERRHIVIVSQSGNHNIIYGVAAHSSRKAVSNARKAL